MENNMIELIENDEVEILANEVVEAGSKMSSMTGIGIGVGIVIAGYVVAKTVPKIGKVISGKIAERKANKVEEDYLTEEFKMDDEKLFLKEEK